MLQCSNKCSNETEEAIMSPTPKINREPVLDDDGANAELRDSVAGLFLRGVERIAEIQKQTLDVAVRQNAEMMDVFKKMTEKMLPGVPRLPFLDLATGAVNRYADTQKSAIDFAVEQTQVWTDAFKNRARADKKATESATNVAKQAMERGFAVHKKALEHTAAQTKAVVDATRGHFGLSGEQADAMTNSFQKGVDTIVEAQKELLDLVTH
jgi:hypothetical protein